MSAADWPRALSLAAAAMLLVGIALAGAALWYARYARRLRRAFAALIASGCRAPERWPEEAWPHLRAAGVAGLSWRGEWLGAPLAGALGDAADAPTWRGGFRCGDDLAIELIAVLACPRGEQGWLARAALELFALLWRQRGMEDMARLESAILALGRRQVALLHRVRNLAQWLQWNAESFAAARDGAELLALARDWRAVAPQVAARARELLRDSAAREDGGDEPAGSLAALADASARLAGVPLAIDGDARSVLPRRLLLEILDNLMINLRQSAAGSQARLQIRVRDRGVGLTLILPQMDFGGQAARLFAPFASGRQDGLGLGLYLARRAARAAGGELAAAERPARFVLELPEAWEAKASTF